MELQLCRGIPHGMSIIFGIVTSIKGEGPLAQVAMNVFHLVGTLHFAHDDDRGFDFGAIEHGGLSHESLNHIHMILG